MNDIYFLIPTTTRNRVVSTLTDCDFIKTFFNSLIKVYNPDKYNYIFYVGYDVDDKFFHKYADNIIEYVEKFQSCKIVCIEIPSINVTLVSKWNYLLQLAITNQNSFFFFQIGDDIKFISKGWEDELIQNIGKTNFYGITGPLDINNSLLLTQTFFTRKHWDIFACLFDDRISNWYCDDWINKVYYPNYLVRGKCKVKNEVTSRYKIKEIDKQWLNSMIKQGKEKIRLFFESKSIYLLSLIGINDLGEIYRRYSEAYVVAKHNNFELVVQRKNLDTFNLTGFNKIEGIRNVLQFSLSDIDNLNLSCSEINCLKSEAYKFTDLVRYSRSDNRYQIISYFETNAKEILFTLEVLEKYIDKQQKLKILWYTNLEPNTKLSTVELIKAFNHCEKVFYCQNSILAYELCIAHKINNTYRLFCDDFSLRPLNFDSNVKVGIPNYILVRDDYISQTTKFLFYYNFIFYHSEEDIISVIGDKKDFLIFNKQPSVIPLIDFNYKVCIQKNYDWFFCKDNKCYKDFRSHFYKK